MQASSQAGRARDEAPQLQRYHSDYDQLVICNPKKPLEWIAADPSSLVEVANDD
jgi:hypothetical protein